ncbi:MAG: helix-turn-helix domain-containing protein [Terriglobales bacterium]
MAYVLDEIACQAAELVRRQPCLTQVEISRRLDVHRHTLERAISAAGLELPRLRRDAVIEALCRHFSTGPAGQPLKEVWCGLGFTSSSAFARYVRRITGKRPTAFENCLGRGHPGRKKDELALDVLGG